MQDAPAKTCDQIFNAYRFASPWNVFRWEKADAPQEDLYRTTARRRAGKLAWILSEYTSYTDGICLQRHSLSNCDD
ncbi:hypothetical protein Tco_1168083 [Tanacetum coccineum]